jgi:hypothetical protein
MDGAAGGARALASPGGGRRPRSPGGYLLRAIVSIDGKEEGRPTQTLRKVQP